MRRGASCFIAICAAMLATAVPASAAPLYEVKASWGDTNLAPGGVGQFVVKPRNIGDAIGKEDLVLVTRLPAEVEVTDVRWLGFGVHDALCSVLSAPPTPDEVVCKAPASELADIAKPPGPAADAGAPLPSGYLPILFIEVSVNPGASGFGVVEASLFGGGGVLPDGSACANTPAESPPLPPCASDAGSVPFTAIPAPFGILAGSFAADLFDAPYPLGEPVRGAGNHPHELRVGFGLNARSGIGSDGTRFTISNGRLRTVEVTMPRGFYGNPEATPKCDPVKFAEAGAGGGSTACPPNTQIGYLNAQIAFPNLSYGRSNFQSPGPDSRAQRVAIYNLEPPHGVAADFGIVVSEIAQGHVYAIPDPAQNYAIKAVAPNIAASLDVSIRVIDTKLWGVPADPAHDRFRAFSEETEGKALGASWGSAPIRPFLTAPMDCGEENGGARIRVDSYNDPDNFSAVVEHPEPMNVSGCEDSRFKFEPDISLQPTDRHAGAPTGLDVDLELPQRDDVAKEAKELYADSGSPKAIPTPPMKKAIVTLPEGMTLSPSAAQGLQSCSADEISLGTNRPVGCPEASRYGTITLHTPLFPADAPLKGHLYIAKQGDHPFHDVPFAVYLVVEEPDRGILVKVPGRLDLDPDTGQITTTIDNIPQFPISDTHLSIKGGVRAGLVNPSTCGTKTIKAEFFAWHDPSTPHVVTDSYEVSEKPDGSPCVHDLAQRPFAPTLTGGTLNNVAGTYSPFTLRLTRTDDDQELSGLDLTLPRGLTGKIAGVTECPEAGIAKALARSGTGQGTQELADPSCPASSYIGSIQAGAGVGGPLTYVGGKAYLAGPYRGAPLSVLVITPATVGPFDLGTVAVRAALHVDPETIEVRISSDPLPLIVHGIPVRLRDVRVRTDRPRFTLNPTSCAEKRLSARVTGAGGSLGSGADDTTVELRERFQAAECASLRYRPRLSLRLLGPTNRGGHPKLRATFRTRKGDANTARASVALPHSAFLDQSHIRTVCTRVQFAQEACPRGAVYGRVRAKTPLLDEVLTGPIYLRSSSNPLPDLVAVFKGRLDANLVGRIDSVRGGIRNTFELVPDVPVSWAVFDFQGGRKGLLINSRNLCQGRQDRVTAKLNAQNGRRVTVRPALRTSCGKE